MVRREDPRRVGCHRQPLRTADAFGIIRGGSELVASCRELSAAHADHLQSMADDPRLSPQPNRRWRCFISAKAGQSIEASRFRVRRFCVPIDTLQYRT